MPRIYHRAKKVRESVSGRVSAEEFALIDSAPVPAKPDALYWGKLVSLGITKEAAKVKAGYSKNTNTRDIQKAFERAAANMSIDEARDYFRKNPKTAFAASVNFYEKASTNAKNNTSDKLKARSALDELLGYKSPQDSNSPQRGINNLVAIFNDNSVSAAKLLNAVESAITCQPTCQGESADAVRYNTVADSDKGSNA